jgi:photosystem II stability/assembly factor-like uncharacterized protein
MLRPVMDTRAIFADLNLAVVTIDASIKHVFRSMEANMRKKLAYFSVLIMLIIGLQACDLIVRDDATPEPGTATLPPTLTPTEEPDVSLPVYSSPVIFRFEMFTPTQGWALTQDNDRILRTVDGGATWLDATPVELHPLPPDVTSLWIQAFFLDAETAWFTPNSLGSELYHTQDGGVSWTITPLSFERTRYFFLDSNIGYALVDLGAGAGSHYVAIHRTVDGGATWTEMFTHEPGEMKSLKEGGQKGGITFLDVCHGWIGGNYPMTDYFYLHTTVDGGMTWALETDISLPDAYAGSWLEVYQPIFVSSTSSYLPVRAMAPDDNTYLLIYRSDDSGATWAFQGGVQGGRSVVFYAPDEGYIAASTELYRTTDGGENWSTVSTSGIVPGEFIMAVEFVDDQHGWVIATPDDETWDPRKLYRTIDGGANWTQLSP